jgi:hypothetical protein
MQAMACQGRKDENCGIFPEAGRPGKTGSLGKRPGLKTTGGTRMRLHGRWRRGLTQIMLGLVLTAASGCMGFLHPVVKPPPAVVESCQAIPACCRGHVYVFLFNGLDPVNYSNLTGLRDYVQTLGFPKTYYGQIYHLWWFEKEVRRIHQEDPDAHFVLVGFSLGSNMAYDVAKTVKKDGIQIDLLVFLSGNHFASPMPHQRPENVTRVVNLLAGGLMGYRGERDWAENVRLSGTQHFDPPTHPSTLEVLGQELANLAATVPVAGPASGAQPPAFEQAPTPRPVKSKTSAKRDKWDFLKPVNHLDKAPGL